MKGEKNHSTSQACLLGARSEKQNKIKMVSNKTGIDHVDFGNFHCQLLIDLSCLSLNKVHLNLAGHSIT